MGDSLLERIQRGGVIFDGGMGSMLIARGLDAGTAPESWNRDRPDVIRSIHADYLRAGALVITTNTFGGTLPRLQRHGLDEHELSLNADGLRLAREAVDAHNGDAFVAFSVGPMGEMLLPAGNATFDDAAFAFDAQLRNAAETGAPDLIVIETMYDAREACVALTTSRAVFPEVPVAVTLTYSSTPRGFFTVMGDDPATAMQRLAGLGADIVGANCSLASGDMHDLARQMRNATSAPLLCQPNAGQPVVETTGVTYAQTPQEFADDVAGMLGAGINAVGGCCGTTPDFIRALVGHVDPATE